MKSKEEQSNKGSKSQRLMAQEKININDSKLKTNYQKDNRQYNVQLAILEEIKKLKVNLEITDKNKNKTIYFTALSLNELIYLNKFFKKFKNYSEAFDYLLKNFTKIDRTKIAYLNNNKEIKIVLLFSINDISETNNNDIVEEGIELVLRHYNSNSSKSLGNLTIVINNLKASLEKFSISIREIKENVNNDKIETDKRINELEKNFYKRINEIKTSSIKKKSNNYEDYQNDRQNDYEEQLEEIYLKFEDYDNEIVSLKKNIEDRYINQKNEINKNNKLFFEKENELSQLIMEKFGDFINKINSLDEKNIEIEYNFNNKITELDNKTNICFNELIKKINNKNASSTLSENDLKIKINGIVGKIIEDNESMEKKLENKINQKIEEFKKIINEQINDKMKLFDEKFVNIENKKNENDNNIINNKIKELEEKLKIFEKTKEINDINSKKFEDLENYKKNIQKTLEKNESINNDNMIKINDLSNKINQLFEKINTQINEKNEIEIIKADINDIINEIKNHINPKLIELDKKIEKNEEINENKMQDKMESDAENNNLIIEEINMIKDENEKNLKETNQNYENKLKEINNKFQETKKEIYSMINKINDYNKEDNKEINNKILILKNEILKTIDSKNSLIENKMKAFDGKMNTYDNKINKITKDNEKFIDKINNIEKLNKSNNDNNKLKEIETNLKSFDLIIKNIDNKLKQIDTLIDLKKIKDTYSSKTLTNSNSNGNLIRNVKMNLYRNNMTSMYDSNSNDNNGYDESSSKKKRYSYYNLLNNPLANKNKEKDKNNIIDLNIDSNILKSEDLDDDFFLFSKIKEIYPYNRYIKLILTYRASRDGDLAKDFHSQCDFIGPNITVVKTKKGYIFGGFTIKSWKHLYKDIKKNDPEYGTEYKDIKAFGFSINKKKIYENGFPDEEIIYCNNNCGACFKNYFFKIFDKCFRNGGICGKIDESNFDGIDKEYEFNGGEKKFDVEEIEVFQIGFR